MFHNNWEDSEAEIELGYIKEHGLEKGQQLYQEYCALREDKSKHPEKYYEIMKAIELQRIQDAKRYQVEGSPEVAVRDVIWAEDEQLQVRELIVHDIIYKHLYVSTITNDMRLDPHNGGPWLYQGQYKKLTHN